MKKSFDSLVKIYNTIFEQIANTSLTVYDNGWQETFEIRYPNSTKAFGSIQFCGGNKKRPYLELRFKRVHLRAADLFEVLDSINEKPFRSDVIRKDGSEPEAIRYHFYEDCLAARQIICKIFNQFDKLAG